MYLSKSAVKELIETKKLVEDYADLDKQLTANGFDLRIAALVEINDGGRLAVEKANNVPPKLGRAFILPGFESRLDGYNVEETILTNSFVELKKHQPYFVISCERVNIPENIMGHNTHRTSLLRFTQSLMGFGFDEAGYRGYLTFVLVPFLDSAVELGSRVAQVSFSLLTGKSNYDDQKETNFQGGKLF